MRDSDYRFVAVEFVQQVAELLAHRGSKNALSIARAWANGEQVGDKALEAARQEAAKDRDRCANDGRDGRYHAAEAAWHLLAPKAKDSIELVAEYVAKAKATRAILAKYGEMNAQTLDAHEYFRAVELELLQDRVARREAQN